MGQFDTPAIARKKFQPELFLKSANLLAEWRLREVQPSRRTAKVELFGNCDEIS